MLFSQRAHRPRSKKHWRLTHWHQHSSACREPSRKRAVRDPDAEIGDAGRADHFPDPLCEPTIATVISRRPAGRKREYPGSIHHHSWGDQLDRMSDRFEHADFGGRINIEHHNPRARSFCFTSTMPDPDSIRARVC